MLIRSFQTPDDIEPVVALWQRCGLTRPWNNPHLDIERKLKVEPGWFLIGVIDGAPIATVMVGYDGHRGWLYYLGVDPAYQRRGYARQLLAEAERMLLERGCPKLNLQVRGGNDEAIAFYKRMGFNTDDVQSMGKRLIPDE